MKLKVFWVVAQLVKLSTLSYIPEDSKLHTPRRENLKSHNENSLIKTDRSWGSSVSVVSHYRLRYRGSIPGRRKRFFL
jgi:hypothetical protein